MERSYDLHLKATELRLGLPGNDDEPGKQADFTHDVNRSNKRASPEKTTESNSNRSNSCVSNANSNRHTAPPPKAQVVGWPPVRSYRKNSLQRMKTDTDNTGTLVKVSVDGAPYLRKIDLRIHKHYPELLMALEKMFKLTIGEYSEREGYNESEYAPTYQDKDGDWMLVGDVPWDMFVSNCKRLRIMRGSDAKGLGSS